jgi:iron(III) transport system ATP-binding protein
MVFQSHALWPHMTVGENVEYALKIRKVAAAERREMVDRALGIVGLVERRDSPPDQLSGGQRQRVALARCLAMEPSVVLMDEPLASLDAHLRENLQAEFHRLHRQLGATIVYVTHDQSEAMALADKVAVIDHGRLQQVAPPRALYAEPATAMVADFVGRGMVVPLDAPVPGRAGSVSAQLWGEPIHLRSSRGGTSSQACLRPEGLSLGTSGVAAKVDRAVFEGAGTILHCRVDCAPNTLLRVFHRAAPPAEGSPVKIAIGDGWLLPAAA